MKAKLRTFNEWSSAGYKILKGSKAVWVDGVPMFSNEQVIRNVFKNSNRYDGDTYDSLAEAYGAYGGFWDHV